MNEKIKVALRIRPMTEKNENFVFDVQDNKIYCNKSNMFYEYDECFD